MENELRDRINDPQFYNCELNSPLFSRPATVMWNRRAIFDGFDIQAAGLQARNSTFATAPRTAHLNVDFLHTEFQRLFGDLLCRALSGERSALATSFETASTGAGPAKRFALVVRDRHGCVVEAGVDMSNPKRHAAPNSSFFRCCCWCCWCRRH